jgi:sodium/pantothenate symporter
VPDRHAGPFLALAGQTSASTWALAGFIIYMAGVFLVAWFSGREKKGPKFISEYFLGSRNLGMWAFALTFAATNASGGSFMGFPSLIYTHGWVLALWIASYMLVPVVTIGLLAKQINQIARKAGAVTVPEVLRERFDSVGAGLLATLMLVLFMFFYLLAQFKAGSIIMTTLLGDVPAYQLAVGWMADQTRGLPWVGNSDPDYLLCLAVFGVTVVAYTTYGGFRAVVWTDVMQGLVMVVGVIFLLFLTVSQVGGLKRATTELAKMTPPDRGTAVLRFDPTPSEDMDIRKGTWIRLNEGNGIVRNERRIGVPAGSTEIGPVNVVKITTPEEIERIVPDQLPVSVQARMVKRESYRRGAGRPGAYVSIPGPDLQSDLGFLSFGMALSFFVFWAFGGAGQPSNMVRLMAFKNTATLRRSIAMVSVYYTLIYFPLVVIFCCARVLMPGMEIDSDRVMPELTTQITTSAGVPWLAGLLIAAPYAAVMSSVDSFLLLVSSALVRDVYHRNINPHASERQLKRLAYWVTCLVGIIAVLGALNPPRYLQDMTVFASSGLAACFLVPMVLGLYWPRMNGPGAIVAILGGCAVHVGLYVLGYLQEGRFTVYSLLGLHPFIWDLAGSALLGVTVALLTKPPSETLVRKYFGTKTPGSTSPRNLASTDLE